MLIIIHILVIPQALLHIYSYTINYTSYLVYYNLVSSIVSLILYICFRINILQKSTFFFSVTFFLLNLLI
jgi:hypothetical protein